MRRILVLALLSGALLVSANAQERRSAHQYQSALQSNEDPLVIWKWIDFALLIGGIGYWAYRKGPAFFNARTEEIQRAIKDATGLKVQAEFRSSEVDRKMATLGAEIQRLREAAKAEMQKESLRIDEETRLAMERIYDHTAREIDSLRRLAQLTLRQHAVQLAVDLSAGRLRDHVDAADRDRLIQLFANALPRRVVSA
jgi:F0F1-type ATP synthase membrane subunit b/b'